MRLAASDTAGALEAARRAQALNPAYEGPPLLALELMDPKVPEAEAMVRKYLEAQPLPEIRMGYARALLDAQRSRLVADGRTPPVIAVRMLDASGKPVRRGLTGEFEVMAPYLSQQQSEALQRDPLAGNAGGRPRFEVGEDGVAAIALQPTTQSGEVVLRFRFTDTRTEEVRAWLNAELREWVLVGFGEGTVGQKRLSGNMEALR
jgi:hypothetical protein